MIFGTNLSFAVKRWVEPEAWAAVVRNDLGLEVAQFSFDIVDPWWPADLRASLAARIRRACAAEGLALHSAFVGLAHYTYNQLLHPTEEGRVAARQWYRNAIDFASDLGVVAVGGPAGALSPADAADEQVRSRRYHGLLDDLRGLSDHAKARGLGALLVEPTPLTREFPWSIEGAMQMAEDLAGTTSVPVQYCFDWGHALYQPLYGNQAVTRPWLEALKAHIGQVQLQQTDGTLDRHWGFTHADGIVDPAEAAAEMRACGLGDTPVFLEVFYPFEWTNEQVLDDIKRTVDACAPAFA
ncbi:MAG: sugar phosphate isomerase/epimerase [Rhodospirillaceae bacterium]|nr:sugar phosphate isomerase/epimerase [Rhodospirillaceae bacterium]MCA8934484.1 sugar phosphate isomerase/epimerase [Rhodospirillaceae bacterium]